MRSERGSFLATTLGPGLLFAGAAVGVSHLVQSTRAGALYGLSLTVVIVAANIIKYPAFSFGPLYAAATGTSLLEGYRRQGRWALWLYAVLTVGTMFTVQGAVTLVTAAIAKALFHLPQTPLTISVGLLCLCIGLLAVGHYHWLDRLIKLVVLVLTILTLVATAMVLPRIDWSISAMIPSGGNLNLLFVAALVGWMPTAIDISVWHSLWTLAKRRDTQHAPSVRDALLDFKIGYIGTAVLALCFMLLGAGVVHGTGAPPLGGAGFANMVIDMYVEILGEWSRYIIGGSALMVMFSTTLTVVDGFPRALGALAERFRGSEAPGAREVGRRERTSYWIAAAVLFVGTIVLLRYFVGKFTLLVDVATTLSFLTAPLLALLNHRAVTSADVLPSDRPSPRMRVFSIACIVILFGVSAAWIYVRFFGLGF